MTNGIEVVAGEAAEAVFGVLNAANEVRIGPPETLFQCPSGHNRSLNFPLLCGRTRFDLLHICVLGLS